jgi:glycosyltransferase involved in cell wall biosynthesis/folate-dependent phosphoribosylglycinamide formyltransferase PurN
MTGKLRVVVFTAGEMTPVDRVFFERLAEDPLLDVAGIVVDQYQPRPKPPGKRILHALRQDGPKWLAFKIRSTARAILDRAVLRVADKIHGPRRVDVDLTTTIYRVSDIHSAESVALIRSLSPDLGVIVGGRILRESVITIPRCGTLNIHKRALPEYRGGGPVGYWEILAGEPSIGVSIHFATRAVDAGPVIAETTIPIEECDTLESLKLKADICGAQMYHDAIRSVAQGKHDAVPQDLSRGTTYRAPSDYKVWQLQRRLERQAATRRAISRPRFAWWTRLRVLAQFIAVLPHLQRIRQRLVREQRAPISIFFYHLVAERALNHLCLPLVSFARQMDFLRRYYAVLSLDDTVARLRSGKNDEIAASITFDDGYRHNAWAIEYLRYFRIPATFFVSVGHVRDGSAFEHDRKRGYQNAAPMSESDVQQLIPAGFGVGSHGVHHEDFGSLTLEAADRTLRESGEQIAEICGRIPDSFAFPKGQRGTNITRPTLALALKHYPYVFSAYGGYAFPQPGRRHFLRISNAIDVFDLHLTMTGYTGFRQCLAGNAWGLETEKLDPCGSVIPKTRVALIAASPEISGGHSAQAQALTTELRKADHEVSWIPIDARFPAGLRWIRRVPYLRTLLNQTLYLPSLLGIARADLVHVFSASYWSFLLGPAPAIIAAKLMRKPVVLHYHSGEADDHLRRWRKSVAPLLRMVDEIVVPSAFLQRVFAEHGYRTRVIPNVIDTSQFLYRERMPLRPRVLSVRNLESYYQVENTIIAFAQLKQRFPEATLTIAGTGSRERALRALAEQLHVSGVRFLGSVDPAAIPQTYDAADIFVNSSVVDNQPVSILEAFASGLPVVSTPTGDIASMLRGGEAGLLVDAGDPAAVANAVTRLLDEPELSIQLARRAREEAERHTWSRIGAEWNTLYGELLSSGAGEALAHGA